MHDLETLDLVHLLSFLTRDFPKPTPAQSRRGRAKPESPRLSVPLHTPLWLYVSPVRALPIGHSVQGSGTHRGKVTGKLSSAASVHFLEKSRSDRVALALSPYRDQRGTGWEPVPLA